MIYKNKVKAMKISNIDDKTIYVEMKYRNIRWLKDILQNPFPALNPEDNLLRIKIWKDLNHDFQELLSNHSTKNTFYSITMSKKEFTFIKRVMEKPLHDGEDEQDVAMRKEILSLLIG
jgi:hypothetical protein